MNQPGWQFDHSYARLPEIFFVRQQPKPVSSPQLVILNEPLACDLGLDFSGLDAQVVGRLLSGQEVPADAMPLAQAYAGHQFGHFTMLGDGRALLLGEHLAPDGRRVDIQFKGSGPTAFSRRGDGLAALGPMLREYLVSEAMNALGVPTTRSLAVVATGERVWRETVLDGAVLTRVASSHLRVGTFQYAAARQDPQALSTLIDYALKRHDPERVGTGNHALALLEAVTQRQARLVAQWMRVGFIHGVMNTDNMTISGETIDYGPCAFIDVYDPETVFSSIDHAGRYAFQNQPAMAQWNLTRLAEALLSQIDPDPDKAVSLAQAVLHQFRPIYLTALQRIMADKIGLSDANLAEPLSDALLTLMHKEQADYTRTFTMLTRLVQQCKEGHVKGPSGCEISQALTSWAEPWLQQVQSQPGGFETALTMMTSANPVYIPRNHIVEDVLQKATRARDMVPLLAFLAVLRDPYIEHPGCERYEQPGPRDVPFLTFCGT